MRLWTLQDDVLIVSHKSKMNVIDNGVIEGLNEAVERAERDFSGIVIWQPEGPFSAGANLKAAMGWVENEQFDKVEKLVADFQEANLRLRYSAVPSVAAVRGLALGGGLELAMHTSRVVAHLESYMGLVEAGVGLVPAGGGLGTLAFRVHDQTLAGDAYPLLEKRFKQVAMGQVAGSAMEAREMGYITECDPIVMHEHELLHAAHGEIRGMLAAGYRAPLPGRRVPAAGDVGIATLKMLLANMYEGHFISDHDLRNQRTHRRHALRRRHRPWYAGRRKLAVCAGAQALQRFDEDETDPGADRAYAQDRQAPSELKFGYLRPATPAKQIRSTRHVGCVERSEAKFGPGRCVSSPAQYTLRMSLE